jgi:hypothetical protein
MNNFDIFSHSGNLISTSYLNSICTEDIIYPSHDTELNEYSEGTFESKDELLETNCKEIETFSEVPTTVENENYSKVEHKKTIMFCVFHKKYFIRENNKDFIFYGVNEVYSKEEQNKHSENVILEYELPIYNPFLQKRGYMETSAYLHVYWNKLYLNSKMVGFSQYDMTHYNLPSNATEEWSSTEQTVSEDINIYNNLHEDSIYLLRFDENYGNMINNGMWNYFAHSNEFNLIYIIYSYNKFFNKKYSTKELENKPFSLFQTNIYPVKIYEKLCSWLEVLVEEIYPWCNRPPYGTHFGFIGGYTERALSIFNAFEIHEGVNFYKLNIIHKQEELYREQYEKGSFLNFYSQNIYTKYIENITGNYTNLPTEKITTEYSYNNLPSQTTANSFSSTLRSDEKMNIEFIKQIKTNTNYSMFKSQCILNDVLYSCERLCVNQIIGLCFKKENISSLSSTSEFSSSVSEIHSPTTENLLSCKFYGFLIRAEDPRLFIFNEKVYVVFICLSPYKNQRQCIAITEFNEWNPIFLQVKDVTKNEIEKNWSPFVKNNKIHFIYNYDPLIVLDYDLNKDGLCNVVFKQNNKSLPINTEQTYLRGGTNLLPYSNEYYIGAAHTRLNTHPSYYSIIVLLNTNKWELVYISKPVMYTLPSNPPQIINNFVTNNSYYSKESLTSSNNVRKKINTTHNIIGNTTNTCIQSPCSLYTYKDKYFITVNLLDTISLVYEISFKNILDLTKTNNDIGYYQTLTLNMSFRNPPDISE